MFEYKILQTDEPTASEMQLNGFGDEGWELVTIMQWNGSAYYFFKRRRAAS